MRRFHLFEFEDQSWCPAIFRRGITEFLAVTARLTRVYRPSASELNRVLRLMEQKDIVVLGAGSGGGVVDLISRLLPETRLTLTDLFPPTLWQSKHSRIRYYSTGVDAFEIPKELTGLRVLYSVFHHFRPEDAKRILRSAVEDGSPIAVFEMTDRSALSILKSFAIPFYVFKWMPRTAPFPGRYFFTYFVPVLPVLIWWDGLISNLRTYNQAELLAMVEELGEYEWRIEERSIGRSSMISLVGVARSLIEKREAAIAERALVSISAAPLVVELVR